MPTQKPRVAVTMPRPIYETIDRMASLTGESKGRVILDLLEAVHPALMRTVSILEAASAAPLQVRQGLRETIEALEKQIVASANLQTAQLDFVNTELRREAPRPTSAPARRRAATPNPRTSNTGVTSPRKRKKGK